MRPGLLGAVAALALLGAAACSDEAPTHVSGSPVPARTITQAPAVTEQPQAVPASACPGAEEAFALFSEAGENEHTASGEAQGVCWRLFVLPAPSADMTEQLCIETVMGSTPHVASCTTAGAAGLSSDGQAPPGRPPPISGPTLVPADPPLVFGPIEASVARVVIETASGQAIEADIVGPAQAHFVAVAPQGTDPVAVITYSAASQQLERFSLLEERWGGWQMSEPEIDCDTTPGPDGSYECRGTASGSAWGSMSVWCHEAEDGEMVCEDPEPEADAPGDTTSGGG